MQSITVRSVEYTLSSENDSARASLECVSENANTILLRVKLSFDEDTAPKPCTVRFCEKMIGYCGMWHPLVRFDRHLGPNWGKRGPKARTASNAPVLSVYGYREENKLTVALSDVRNASELCCGVREENGMLDVSLRLLTSGTELMREYETEIRIDRSPVSFFDAIEGVRRYWESCGYRNPSVPAAAYAPVYSTWYNFHQELDETELLRELKLAKAIGMDTVIVDDGWQTDNASRGYGYCGDWEVYPKKFADMKKFTDAVHALGMKVMVWYSVPFVGFFSKNYERFKGKYLYSHEHVKTSVLDPRYPEVRAFLTGIYADSVRSFGLDGLKLDFIDEFRLASGSNTDYEHMDFRSVEEAVEQLLSDVCAALKAIRPDILLEFRQGYIGPVVTTYGNILRVSDCPNDPLSNRIGAVDLRLLSNIAVHSDMLMWHREDSVSSVACQLLCVMFAVPQISVRLASLSEAHAKCLSSFLDFWKQHRSTLMHGKLSARGVASAYTQVTAEGDGEAVTVCYEDSAVTLSDMGTHYIFNGSPREAIFLDASNATSPLRVRVYDHEWTRVASYSANGGGLLRIPASDGGYAVVERLDL